MNSHKKAQKSAKKTAFTLIELLTVIMVLGILFGFLSAAISKARENAKRGRVNSDVNTLGAAIWAYRHEYGRWPCSQNDGVYQPVNNSAVIEYMKNPAYNARGLQFVNWSEYLWENPDESGNLVDPWGSAYFIVLNIDSDTVTVSNATTGATKTL